MSRTNIDAPFSMYDGTITTIVYSRTDRQYPWRQPPYVEVLTKRQTLYGHTLRNSTVTPSYKFALRFGNLPENPFAFVKSTYTKYQGTIIWQNAYTQWFQQGAFGGDDAVPLFFSGLQLANLDNQVKQKASSKIKDQDINLGQAFAERDQTFKLIAESLKRLAKTMAALKRGDYAAAAKALGIKAPSSSGFDAQWRRNQSRAVARGWLELQYGWRPLLSDIYGAANAANKFHSKREFQVVKTSVNSKMQSSKSIQSTYTADVYEYDSTCTKTIIVKMKRTSLPLATLSSLGLTNPAVIAWELVPFSFVFDWLVPVGSFLNQFDAHIGWSFSSGSITTFMKENVKMTRSTHRVPPGYDYYSETGSKSTEWVTCVRSPLVGFGSLLSMPFVKDPTSLVHAANALALFMTHKR